MKTLFCNADHEHTESCYEEDMHDGIVTVKEDTVIDGIPVKAGDGVLLVGVTKLSNYPEDNAGGDLLNVVYDEVKQLKAENAALIAALKELITYAEEVNYLCKYEWGNKIRSVKIESAIENAKSLIADKETSNKADNSNNL